jgi:cellulose synthase/poly-beta-1,6-N-acetylglucosamine synthase-like glycosyltransferase
LLSSSLVLFVLGASIYVLGFALLGLRKRRKPTPSTAYTRFLVLVPAHNEGWGIVATLRSLRRADYPVELLRIAVIADNCTDNTAEVARDNGVEVWIRNEPQNPGKGQALSWALDKAALPFDIVTVIDADTVVDPLFFAAIDSEYAAQLHAGRTNIAFQGRYVFAESGRTASWFEQFTVAAKAAENSLCYRPRAALGLSCLIQGNGFCVSHTALNKVPFGATSIVEDAEYAVALALNGIPVVYADEALVVSRMTQSLRDAAPQRKRWAGGTIALLFNCVPRLLSAALRQRRWKLAEMALMLLLTSRLLLIYASLFALGALDLAYRFRNFDLVALALAAALILQAIYLYLVLRRADSTPIPLQTIAFMPFYVGFIGAMQLSAVLGFKRSHWTRTPR